MIEERKIDQGTVIYGIRSRKYPECACYGVIITARCDIAQGKVPKYYYLVGVDVDSWLKSAHGYELAYGNLIKGKRHTILQKAAEVELDGETLVEMPDESVEIIIADCLARNAGHNKQIKAIRELQKAIEEFRVFYRKGMKTVDRVTAIKTLQKHAVSCIKNIDSGEYHHYYYLPQHAYLHNDVMDKGLVVDLLEIGAISLDDAERITNPHRQSIIWDNMPKLPEKDELEHLSGVNEQGFHKMMSRVAEHFRLINAYWMTDKDCFVDIEGTAESPWCEHLMQRFSNAFIRIGISNPNEGDFKNIVKRVQERTE